LKKDFENWTEKDTIDIEDIIDFDNHVLLKFKPVSSLEQDLNGSDHLTDIVNIANCSCCYCLRENTYESI